MNNLNLIISSIALITIMAFIIQKFFIHFKKFDKFNHRTSHNSLATKTGGISIFVSVFLITLIYYLKGNEIFDFSILIPLSIMFIVGVYDDFYEADFKLKFLLQIIVAKIIIDQGYIIDSFHGIFGIYELPWIFAQLFTTFVFLVIVNSYNFIDGIDGLAIFETIKTVLFIELLSVENSPIYMLGIIIISLIIPLIFYNFKKQHKIFLGDAGSLILGTFISICVFNIFNENYIIKNNFNINKGIFSMILLAYPLMDLLRVFIIRIYNKKSPFIADKNHIHHKILNIVKSHFLVVITIQFISLIFIFVTISLLN